LKDGKQKKERKKERKNKERKKERKVDETLVSTWHVVFCLFCKLLFESEIHYFATYKSRIPSNCLFLCLYISLSLSKFVSLSLYFSLSLSHIYIYKFVSICLVKSKRVQPELFVSLSISNYLSLSLSLFLSLFLKKYAWFKRKVCFSHFVLPINY